KENPAFRKMLRRWGSTNKRNVAEIFDPRVWASIASLGGPTPKTIELQTRVNDGATGSDRWFAIKASTVDGTTVEGSLQDITERFAAIQRLEFLAHHDPLTECLNLRGLAKSLQRRTSGLSALAY